MQVVQCFELFFCSFLTFSVCLLHLSNAHDQVSFLNSYIECWPSVLWYVRWFLEGMASSEMPPPSIRHGVRIVPLDSNVTVEEVPLAVS